MVTGRKPLCLKGDSVTKVSWEERMVEKFGLVYHEILLYAPERGGYNQETRQGERRNNQIG